MTQALNNGAWIVMIDELATLTEELITNTAAVLGHPDYKPAYQHRWGAYLVDGPKVNYNNLDVGLAYLLQANARIAPEFYPYLYVGPDTISQTYNYWRSNTTSHGARDIWLGQYFTGGAEDPNVPVAMRPAPNRLNWLMAYRAAWNSQSFIHPTFATYDRYLMSGTSDSYTAMKFLDRMFYVYKTRTGYGALIHDGNDGGLGSYKWEAATVLPTGRDEGFAESYGHYCVQHLSSSRLGLVPTP